MFVAAERHLSFSTWPTQESWCSALRSMYPFVHFPLRASGLRSYYSFLSLRSLFASFYSPLFSPILPVFFASSSNARPILTERPTVKVNIVIYIFTANWSSLFNNKSKCVLKHSLQYKITFKKQHLPVLYMIFLK